MSTATYITWHESNKSFGFSWNTPARPIRQCCTINRSMIDWLIDRDQYGRSTIDIKQQSNTQTNTAKHVVESFINNLQSRKMFHFEKKFASFKWQYHSSFITTVNCVWNEWKNQGFIIIINQTKIWHFSIQYKSSLWLNHF